MRINVPIENGSSIDFECEDTFASRWVSRGILAGETYPHLPWIEDVQVIFDVGGNCGATTVHFARHYPDAQIHTFEPGSTQRAYLERNVAALPNVRVHPIGMHATDMDVPLFPGEGDSGMSSLIRGPWNSSDSEMVVVKAAGPWAVEHGIDRIDVLKIDVEGVEVQVLESLVPLLDTVKVLYVEYDSRLARRRIDRLLEATHELYSGKIFLDQGEMTYISRDLADSAAATDWLRSQLTGE